MLRRRLLRQPIDTHNEQQELDEIFASLQTMLELHENMLELAKQTRDPIIQKAYSDTRREITEKMKVLYGKGISVVDLVKRFGGLLVKSQILQAEEMIQKTEAKQGEIVLTDLVAEDELIEQKNNRNQILQLGKDLRMLPQKDTLGALQKNKRLQEILIETQARINVQKQTDVGLQEIESQKIEIEPEIPLDADLPMESLISEEQVEDEEDPVLKSQLQYKMTQQHIHQISNEINRMQQAFQDENIDATIQAKKQELADLQKKLKTFARKLPKGRSKSPKKEGEKEVKVRTSELTGPPRSPIVEEQKQTEEQIKQGEDIAKVQQELEDLEGEKQRFLGVIKDEIENLLKRKQRLPAEIESYKDTVRGRKVYEFVQNKIVGEGEPTPYETEIQNIILSFTPEVGQVKSLYKKIRAQIKEGRQIEKQIEEAQPPGSPVAEEEELKINEATQKAGKKLQNAFLDYYKDQYPENYKKVAEKLQKKGSNKAVDDQIIERLVAYQFGQISKTTASQTLSTSIVQAFDAQIGSKMLREKIKKLKEENDDVDIDVLSTVSQVQKKKKTGVKMGGPF